MSLPEPRPGLVIHYSYLWQQDAAAGQEEGVKHRPCAIVVADQRHQTPAGEKVVVTVVPITHTPPRDPTLAVEMTLGLKRLLGLDDEPSWIICDEVNDFVWPGPDMAPVPGRDPKAWSYGFLPPGVFRSVRDRILACYTERRLSRTARTD